MKLLAYAGREFLTGDEIAAALLDYSQALADVGSAGSVDIPVVGDHGELSTATFLVGPASQIVAMDADPAREELVDDVTVERLRRLTRALHPSASPIDPDPVEDFDLGD